jgi:hypothetical protein
MHSEQANTAESDPSFLEQDEFNLIASTECITEQIDSGIELAELADWCKEHHVPKDIVLELMHRAITGEAFIIY